MHYNTVNKLLRDLAKANEKYKNNPNYRLYNNQDTVFERSGLLNSDGSPKTYSEIKRIYGKSHLETKINRLSEMLEDDYIDKINENYKESYIRMLSIVGDEEEIERIENMNINEFMEDYAKGNQREFVEKYLDITTDKLIRAFTPKIDAVYDDPSTLL